MQPGQYSLDLIVNPQDIENFDELDENNAYVSQAEPVSPLPQDQKLLKIKNNLGTITANLEMFRNLVQQMNHEFMSRPTQVNSKERAISELNKAYTCKLKCLGEMKKRYQLQDYLKNKIEEESKMEQSLQKIAKQFAFATSQQLKNFARAFKFPNDDGNFIYANLYHDKLSGDFPCLKLAKKDDEIKIMFNHLKLKGEYFVIDLKGQHQRWISIPQDQNSVYEKLIFEYIKRKKETKRQILNYTIEFKYIDENSADFNEIRECIGQNLERFQNILFAKLLHELIIKPNGSLETYFQFVKIFILEQQNQEITDSQRYQNILTHIQHPELIQGVGK